MSQSDAGAYPARLGRACGAGLLVWSLTVGSAFAEGRWSEASELSAAGIGSVAAGSALSVVGTVELVVDSVEWLADGVRCTLHGSAEVGRVVLILPVKAAGAVSLAAGQTVVVIAEASGWLITKAGQVIAYIPNQAGRALLFSTPQRGP